MSSAIPQNLESEAACLGAMIQSTRAIEIVDSLGLTGEEFYRPQHRLVFDAIRKLDAAGTVDERTVINELKRTGKLTEVGGPVAVMSLVERCPAVANVRAYAEDVRAYSVNRMLVEAGQEISRLGYEHPEAPELLVSAANEIASRLTTGRSSSDGFETLKDQFGGVADAMAERWEAVHELSGLTTGFVSVDQVLGGLQGGNTYIIAARPAMGKTAFSTQIADHIAVEQGKPVALFSLEMTKRDLAARLLAGRALVDSRRLTSRRPLQSDFDRVAKAMEVASRKGAGMLFIDDTADLTAFDIKARTRRLARRLERMGTPLAGVVIDYMQLIRGRNMRVENKNLEMTQISRDLKIMSMELDVPVLALSQLSRQSENRPDKRPQLADLRDSGSLEQDASAVVFIHRPGYYAPDNPDVQGVAEIIVAKNRHGETGSAWLEWDGAHTRFGALDAGAYVPGVAS